MRDKDRRQSKREKGEGTREGRRQRTASGWERRQTWPIGKWWFVKIEEKTPC